MAPWRYLNKTNYAGSNQWRLPTVANTSFGFNTPTNGTTAGDELPELFYSELGGTAGSHIPFIAKFDNFENFLYWYGTEYAPDPIYAWNFITFGGNQYYGNKDSQFYAWAVSSGQITPVPEADSVAMLLVGLGLVGGVVRRHRG